VVIANGISALDYKGRLAVAHAREAHHWCPASWNDCRPIANTQSARYSRLINGLITGRNAIRRRRLPGLVVT
jgi:hypothetical protein